jgi:hypothetical protein
MNCVRNKRHTVGKYTPDKLSNGDSKVQEECKPKFRYGFVGVIMAV